MKTNTLTTSFANFFSPMRRFSAILLFIVLGSGLVMQGCSKDDDISDPTKSEKFTQLDDAMHKLWADHMVYTYTTVDAFLNNPDAVTGNLTRLLKNQEDIGNALIPYYGADAGKAVTDSLKAHINGAVPVLTAAKEGNTGALNAAIAAWHDNATNIGILLSSVNPDNFNKDEMIHMMNMHIDQTVAYSVALLNKDYPTAVAKFDEAFNHMTEMAHDLSLGIAKQFPNKF